MLPNGNYYNGTIEFARIFLGKGDSLAALFEEAIGVLLPWQMMLMLPLSVKWLMVRLIGMKDFIMITLGTGVGSGIVINGQLVYGHDGFAGELGHAIVRRDGRQCGLVVRAVWKIVGWGVARMALISGCPSRT